MAEQRIRHKPGFDVPAIRPEEQIFEEMGVRFERITMPRWWHPEHFSISTFATSPSDIDSVPRYVGSELTDDDEPAKEKSTHCTIDDLLM